MNFFRKRAKMQKNSGYISPTRNIPNASSSVVRPYLFHKGPPTLVKPTCSPPHGPFLVSLPFATRPLLSYPLRLSPTYVSSDLPNQHNLSLKYVPPTSPISGLRAPPPPLTDRRLRDDARARLTRTPPCRAARPPPLYAPPLPRLLVASPTWLNNPPRHGRGCW